MPALESPNFNLAENENALQHPLLGARTFTLPEMNVTGVFYGNDVSFEDQQPLTFHAPELPIETLLDRSHNETLAKLNFVVALCDCILEVADAKCAPLSAIMSSPAAAIALHAPEHCKRSERLVLLVRYVKYKKYFEIDIRYIRINSFSSHFISALHLLSSGLNLAMKQISEGSLKPSDNVKNGK